MFGRNVPTRTGGENHIRAITHMEEFLQLRPEWESLTGRNGRFLPFLSFDWFEVWLKHFLASNQLFIVMLYRRGSLVMIAPFLMKYQKCRGISIRKMELLGNAYSPIRYFVSGEDRIEQKKEYISAVLDFLVTRCSNWDILELSAIPEENGYFSAIEQAIMLNSLSYSPYVCFADWYRDGIESSGDVFLADLPTHIRKDILYCLRRLQKIKCTKFSVVCAGDSLEDNIDRYYDVYARSWQEREGIGPTFHRDLARIAAKNGWLRLGFLLHGESAIAAQLWLSCNGTAYILKTVYDQTYKKYSPGKILTAEMFKRVIDEDRVGAIDYVQGDESYKKDWTSQRRERRGVLVYNMNVKGRYLSLVNRRILPVLKKSALMRGLRKGLNGQMTQRTSL